MSAGAVATPLASVLTATEVKSAREGCPGARDRVDGEGDGDAAKGRVAAVLHGRGERDGEGGAARRTLRRRTGIDRDAGRRAGVVEIEVHAAARRARWVRIDRVCASRAVRGCGDLSGGARCAAARRADCRRAGRRAGEGGGRARSRGGEGKEAARDGIARSAGDRGDKRIREGLRERRRLAVAARHGDREGAGLESAHVAIGRRACHRARIGDAAAARPATRPDGRGAGQEGEGLRAIRRAIGTQRRIEQGIERLCRRTEEIPVAGGDRIAGSNGAAIADQIVIRGDRGREDIRAAVARRRSSS